MLITLFNNFMIEYVKKDKMGNFLKESQKTYMLLLRERYDRPHQARNIEKERSGLFSRVPYPLAEILPRCLAEE